MSVQIREVENVKKMKHLICLLALLAACFAATAQESFEYEPAPTDRVRVRKTESFGTRMAHKWTRGMTNTLTGVMEIPVQTGKGFDKGVGMDGGALDSTAGATVGLAKGIWYTAGRIEFGLFELLTFWAVNPPANQNVGVNFDGRFPWSRAEQIRNGDVVSYDGGERSAEGVLSDFGNKIERGAGNFVFGGSELVYQVRSEQLEGENGSVAAGVGKGLYYWLSRELSGLHDLVFFAFPLPVDNVGPAWDIPDPWSYVRGPMPGEDSAPQPVKE